MPKTEASAALIAGTKPVTATMDNSQNLLRLSCRRETKIASKSLVSTTQITVNLKKWEFVKKISFYGGVANIVGLIALFAFSTALSFYAFVSLLLVITLFIMTSVVSYRHSKSKISDTVKQAMSKLNELRSKLSGTIHIGNICISKDIAPDIDRTGTDLAQTLHTILLLIEMHSPDHPDETARSFM